jgi:hypothetical protein
VELERWGRSVGAIVWRNEGVLRRAEEARNVLHPVTRRKSNWNYYILGKNCLIKHAIDGKIEERIEVTRRQERRRKQLLKGMTGYWNLKKEALHCTLCISRFGKGYGTVVRWTVE